MKVEAELKQPGFDKIERKHPIVRWTALDDVNVSRGHKLVAETGDKVVGASDQGPILIAGQRGGFKFVALGFDTRDSDLPLRVAWPLLLLNSINWFTDEDSQYISSFRTGDVWRVPVVSQSGQARLKTPGGLDVFVPVHEGRAVYLGEKAGFYELSGSEGNDPSSTGTSTTGGPAATTGSLCGQLARRGRERDRARSRAGRRREEGWGAVGVSDRGAP